MQIKSTLKKAPLIFLGSFICALSASYFILPGSLLAGGVTGIALVLNSYFALPVSTCIWFASMGFLMLGLLAVGKEFALNSLIGSIGYPLCFDLTSLLAKWTGPITDDVFLCTVFAAALLGVGWGIILRCGASSGATDVVAVVLNRRLGLPTSLTLNIIDAALLCLQMPFSIPENILYSLIFITASSTITGKVMVLGKAKIQVQIISDKYEKINKLILGTLNHGSTLIHIEGGYTRHSAVAIQTVITKRELFRVREAALQIDPQAFIVINPVSEVNGRGFTLSQHYKASERDFCDVS